METNLQFKKQPFGKRLRTMLRVDLRRMFGTPMLYLVLACCLAMPVLILVMTTMFGTGPEASADTFTNTWQAIGALPGETGAAMSLTSMCNINMLYFLMAVPVCLFVSEDFKSGFAKTLFAVRAKKSDYVASKTLVCTAAGLLMLALYFLGTVIGGAIAGLSFALEAPAGLVFCMLAKGLLTAVFVPVFLVMSVAARRRTWLSLCLSFGVGMFLFNLLPALSPLNATPTHLLIGLLSGLAASAGLGAVSNAVLRRVALV